MTVHAPVAGEARGHALSTRAVRIAIEEGEVRGDQIGPVGHPHRQFRRKMMLSLRNSRQKIGPRRGAIHAERFPRCISDQGLIQRGKSTEELSGKCRQIIDNQLQSPSRGALQLIGSDSRDGGASAAFVRDPVKRVLGGVLTVTSQVTFVLQGTPAAVWILGPQTVPASLVHGTLLHFDLRHCLLRHHVQVHQLRIEQEVGVHRRIPIDFQVAVLQPQGRTLHHHL